MKKSVMLNTIKFFGKGSAFTPDANTSFMWMIRDCNEPDFNGNYNDSAIFVEMPMTTVKEVIEKKLVDGVKNFIICISHLHEDHVGGLGIFLSYLKYVKGIDSGNIKILSPNNQEMMTYLNLTTKIDINGIHICSGIIDVFLNGSDEMIRPKITIEPIETQHIVDMPSIGFLFTLKDENHLNQERLFYTGDCTKIPDDIFKLFKNKEIDTLIAEVSSLPPEGSVHCSFQYYLENFTLGELRRIIFVHFDDLSLRKRIDDLQELATQMPTTAVQ